MPFSPDYIPRERHSDARTTPPILRLPLDVLAIILSIVVPSFRKSNDAVIDNDNDDDDDDEDDDEENGGDEKEENAEDDNDKDENIMKDQDTSVLRSRKFPLQDIRSTCRIFRWIADQLPFWYADDFNIAEVSPTLLYQESFFEVFLSDSHLQICLSQKQSWLFFEPRVFEIVSRKIPHFGAQVHSLKFHSRRYYRTWNGSGRGAENWGGILEAPLRPLRSSKLNITFTNLTFLEIVTCNHIHLYKFPLSLRVLRLTMAFPKCNCKNSLPHLEDFMFSAYGNEPLEFKRLLPVKSKSTLTRFEVVIRGHLSSSQYVDDMKLLIDFIHITDLALYPLTSEMCQILVGSPLRLKSFSTYSYYPHQLHTGPLRDLITSSVLGEARTFSYGFRNWEEFGPDTRPIYEPLIQLITSLTDLEELHLGYPLHEDWFANLQTCTSLRKIVWDYSDFPTREVPYHFKFEDTRLAKALRAALSNLDPAPYVRVLSCYRPEQRGIWRLKEEKARELRATRKLKVWTSDSSVEKADETNF